MNEMIEKLARALCVANEMEPDRVITAGGMLQWEAFKDDAATVVSAIDKMGFVIVPREPTEAMIEAGVRQRAVGRHTNRAIYKAMIDTALAKD